MKMKIFIAFLLVFSLTAASVFADPSIGGFFNVYGQLAKGDTESGNDPLTNMGMDYLLSMQGGNADNSFYVKGALANNNSFWIYGWWKPVKMLMVMMGKVFEDSTWIESNIAKDGFHNNKFTVRQTENFAGNVLNAGTGFFAPAMNANQLLYTLQVSLYPIDGLSVNLGFPLRGSTPDNKIMTNFISKLHAQVAYKMEGIGEAAVTFINAPEGPTYQNIFAQWTMPIGYDMRLELGGKFGFNKDALEPLETGLGFGYGSLENDTKIVVNARAGASIPMEDNQLTKIGFDALFSYDLNIVRVYVPAGIGIELPTSGDSRMYWNFNPYVGKRLGGPFVYGGVQLYSGTWNANGRVTSTDGLTFAVPIGFRWDF